MGNAGARPPTGAVRGKQACSRNAATYARLSRECGGTVGNADGMKEE